MAESISRKQFFRTAFFQTARYSVDLLEALKPVVANQQESMNHAFEADFPPELLSAEAERLGLDPDDKAAVFAAISERLEVPKG